MNGFRISGFGGRRRGAVLIATSAAALLLAPSSVGATEAGVGVGTGSSTANNAGHGGGTNPICALESANITVTLNDTGTYTATDSTGTSVRSGNTVATIKIPSGYYFNPAGTFSDINCTSPLAIATTATVVSSPSGSVSCPASAQSGTYQRVSSTAVFKINASAGSCSVRDSSSGVTRTAAQAVTTTWTGNQIACLSINNSPNPCDTAPEFQGAYTEI